MKATNAASARDRLILALDVNSTNEALALFEKTSPFIKTFKVGLELFTALGPSIVRTLREAGAEIFLDLKLHDIPNTVHKAVFQAQELGVQMLTVHALGGKKMLSHANACLKDRDHPLKLLAVTVLTHHDQHELTQIGFNLDIETLVQSLATGAMESGISGLVCSPLELPILRKRFGHDLVLVTPGIRPAHAQKNDQNRTMTPFEAIRHGADYLVIGRPITDAPEQQLAAKQIHDEVSEALNEKI